MAAAVSSVESVCNFLNRSRLLKAQELQAVYRQWRSVEVKGAPGELDRFLKWLTANHYLTPYQAHQLLLGQTEHLILNHYKLLDLIGKGRMAGIFKASHTLGHIVAIKVMASSTNEERQLLGRFKREARMAVGLKHVNVVRTFHLGTAAGRHYLVMEYLEGETLEDVLKRRRKLSCPEGVRLIHQALKGLEHIHFHRLVHRDLKPANLMLVPVRPPGAPDDTLHATVKILDIGLGKILFDEGANAGSHHGQLTTEGMILGTAEYMAPEQARDARKADIRSDLYSVGCLLYHVLSGQTPFTEKSTMGQIICHAQQVPRPIRAIEPSVPAGLQLVLDKLLAKDPNQRYQTPEWAIHALQAFLPKLGPETAEVSSLTQSYLKWVDTQPLEEVNAAPTAAQRWYFSHNGQIYGPVPGPQLPQCVTTRALDPNDPIWMEGDDPRLAIQAKAAIDFAALARLGSTPAPRPAQPAALPVAVAVPVQPARSTQTQPARTTAIPPPRTTAMPLPAARLIPESGFNPETGEILDKERFKQWQREQSQNRVQETSSGPTLQEVYLKATVHLDRWLDFDRNRRPILFGDMDFIRQDPDIQRFMLHHARYGQDLVHKLWDHLQFMVENRRKYYCALVTVVA